MTIAIGGIYYDTVASLAKIGISVGGVSASLSLLKGEVELVGFGVKKSSRYRPSMIDQSVHILGDGPQQKARIFNSS